MRDLYCIAEGTITLGRMLMRCVCVCVCIIQRHLPRHDIKINNQTTRCYILRFPLRGKRTDKLAKDNFFFSNDAIVCVVINGGYCIRNRVHLRLFPMLSAVDGR